MTDAVQIFDAAWQMPINSLTGLPYADGVVSFYLASTTTPLEVFSDADLTVTLGVSVACDASGFPVSSGNAKTLIYVGTTPFKIDITSAIYGGTLFEADNVRGAVDTSLFVTSAVPARKSIVPTSANRALTVADLGKLINANPTAGTLTMTLDPAATLGDGWWAGISHDGSANMVRVIGNGVDTFARNGISVTSFALTGRGQVEYIVCNGTGFRVDGQIPPLIGANTGIILIADRLATPPGSPLPGARYIVTAAPAGAWSTFAEHDIAEANGGGGWFKYTPKANGGWCAYVQSTRVAYTFRGTAWSDGTPTIQRLLSGSGTCTPSAGAAYWRVRMRGGGGGGAAQATNDGLPGSASSFGTWTAVNGAGGSTSTGVGGIGGTGGVNGTGTLIDRQDGQNGGQDFVFATGGAGTQSGGTGGGIGGGSAIQNTVSVIAGKANTGSGGGGASGGSGGGAGEYVEFIVPAPTATSYTVGAGGNGGAAGTVAGGNGSAGVIIVEEFYS